MDGEPDSLLSASRAGGTRPGDPAGMAQDADLVTALSRFLYRNCYVRPHHRHDPIFAQNAWGRRGFAGRLTASFPVGWVW